MLTASHTYKRAKKRWDFSGLLSDTWRSQSMILNYTRPARSVRHYLHQVARNTRSPSNSTHRKMRLIANHFLPAIVLTCFLLPVEVAKAQTYLYNSKTKDSQLAGAAFGMVYRLCRELYLHKTITLAEAKSRAEFDLKYLSLMAKSLQASDKGLSTARYVHSKRWENCLAEKTSGTLAR